MSQCRSRSSSSDEMTGFDLPYCFIVFGGILLLEDGSLEPITDDDDSNSAGGRYHGSSK